MSPVCFARGETVEARPGKVRVRQAEEAATRFHPLRRLERCCVASRAPGWKAVPTKSVRRSSRYPQPSKLAQFTGPVVAMRPGCTFEGLRALLADVVAHVPCYRRQLGTCSFDRAAVQRLEYLQHLPLLTKTESRAHCDDFRRHLQAGPLARLKTGGISGESLVMFIGKERVSHDVAVKWRVDKPPCTGLLRALEMSDAKLDDCVAKWRAPWLRMLLCCFSEAIRIARHAEQQGAAMNDLVALGLWHVRSSRSCAEAY